MFAIAAGGATAIAAAVTSVIAAGVNIIAGIAETGGTVIGAIAIGVTIAPGAVATTAAATITIGRMRVRLTATPTAGRMRTASACAGGELCDALSATETQNARVEPWRFFIVFVRKGRSV